MAEAMIGFGIGLTGTPKDYTGIVAAQQRQKGIEAAKKREDESRKYAEYIKSTAVKDHMNYSAEEIPIELGKSLDQWLKARDNGDTRAQYDILNRATSYIDRKKAESDEFKALTKEIQSGKKIIDADWTAIQRAKSPEEIQQIVGPSFKYDPDTKRTFWNAVDKVNFPKLFMDIVDKTPQIGGTEKIKFTGPGGYVTELGALDTDPVRYQARVNAAWEIDPDIQENAIIQYKDSKGWLGKTAEQISSMTGKPITEQDIYNESKKMYIDSSMNFLETQFRALKNEPKGVRVDISMGAGEGVYGTGELTPKTIMSGFTQPDKSVENREVDVYSTTIKPFPALGWITSSLRNQSTNELIKKSDIIDFNWGEIGVAPVWKGDFTYDGKTTKGVKGKLVSKDMLALAEQQGLVEYKVIMAGTGKIKKRDENNNIIKKDGKEIEETIDAWRDAKDVIGASSLPKDKTKVLEEQYSKAQILANELNAKLPKSKTSTTAAPEKKSAVTTPKTGKSKWESMKEK